MFKQINSYDFHEAFRSAGRDNQFSYSALNLLFEYLEQREDDIGEKIVLDVISLCCDYIEDTAIEIALNYNIDIGDVDTSDDEAVADIVIEYLKNNTWVVGVAENEQGKQTIVYQQF